MYKFCTCFVKFITKYLILFNPVVKIVYSNKFFVCVPVDALGFSVCQTMSLQTKRVLLLPFQYECPLPLFLASLPWLDLSLIFPLRSHIFGPILTNLSLLASRFNCETKITQPRGGSITSHTVFNSSGESGHPCLIPDLKGKASSLSAVNMPTVGFSQILFIRLRSSFIPSWLSTFYLERF